MNFESFAQAHGLIIRSIVMNKWVRVPTVDHPHKLNGSYKYDGDVAFLQNWAIHESPVRWVTDAPYKRDIAKERAKSVQASKERLQAHQNAAKKAAFILNNSAKAFHPYLAKKGFPQEQGWVWNELLIIPMRIKGDLVGAQLIQPDGTKKFLAGQVTKGAYATFDNKGIDIVTEGYATALSVRRVLKTSHIRYRIHVTFSAGNLPEIAKEFPQCVVVADNDATGIKVAQKTGRPYWVSGVEGEDFNDAEVRGAGLDLLDLIRDSSKNT
jgi:putative DNA primase/helicase